MDTNSNGEMVDVAGNRFFPKAPRTTLSGGADLTLFQGDKGSITLSGDVAYQSRNYALPGQKVYDPTFPLVATADELRLPASTVGNARLRWEGIPLARGLKGYAMLWVRNFTNYREPNNKIEFGPNFGGIITANYYDPRTYGVTFGFKY